MAHATYLLAAASGLIEGVVCQAGQAVSAPVSHLSPAGEDMAGGMAALAKAAGWSGGPAVIVVALDHVGFRRLSFPFRDARRIRQSLRFSLDLELLDGVDTYAVDHELIVEGSGAHAVVSLLRQDLLRSFLQVGAGLALQPYRVLSAAHALLAAHPPASPHHVQIYVGAEEAFVTLAREGRVDHAKVLPGAQAEVLAELGQHGAVRPEDLYRLLLGASDDTEEGPGQLRFRLLGELREIVDEIGRYLRVQALPPGTTLSLHGLYAPWIAVDLVQGLASLNTSPAAESLPRREALGIVEDLRAAPAGVLSGKGPSFHRAAASWRGIASEALRPAIAFAVLLVLVIGMASAAYIARTVSLQRQLARTQQDLNALLVKRVGGNVPESARSSMLRELLMNLRDQARAVSRTGSTPYAMLGALTELSVQAAAVQGVTVESVQITGTQITMAGQTPSFQAAEALRDRLGAAPRFRGRTVKLTYQRAGQSLAYRVTLQ
jgi:type II secretory pathway component PulL